MRTWQRGGGGMGLGICGKIWGVGGISKLLLASGKLMWKIGKS